jgi:hypothetical protein
VPEEKSRRFQHSDFAVKFSFSQSTLSEHLVIASLVIAELELSSNNLIM